MNYTENYQLPQWVESDRVLMEDFNGAMSKVDTKIREAQEASPWKCLKTMTVASSVEEVVIDVTDLNLTDYYELRLYCEFSSATTGTSVSLRVNDLSTYYESNNTHDSMAGVSLGTNPVHFFCCFQLTLCGYVAGCCNYTYSGGTQFGSSCTDRRCAMVLTEDLQKLQLRCYNALVGAGTRLKLFGIKK